MPSPASQHLGNWLQRVLGNSQTDRHTYAFDDELNHMLRLLAQREGRSEQQLVSELLNFALNERFAAEEYLHLWHNLTRREQQVVALLCQGFSYHQIASWLVISYETVKSHARNALNKFRLKNLAELRSALDGWDFSQWPGPSE